MDNEAKGYILRPKCLSYEQGEKSTKYFLNLEKTKATKGTIRSLIDDDDIEITGSKDIIGKIKNFYMRLFTKTSTENKDSCKHFLSHIQTSVLEEMEKIFARLKLQLRVYINPCVQWVEIKLRVMMALARNLI